MGALRDLIADYFHRHPRLFALSALTAMGLVAYANSLPNGFHYDDLPGIVNNPSIHDLRKIPSYFTDLSTFAFIGGNQRIRADWRPILQITYALDYFMAGPNPAAFRVFNLLFHVGSAFLIFLIVAEIVKASPPKLPFESRAGADLFALLPAALFAVHPANAEVVNYIWARGSLLAAFFYLLAFYGFLRGPLNKEEEGSALWYWIGVGSFALGVGSKATAVTLPAALFLYEILFLCPAQESALTWLSREPWRLKKYIPVAAIFLGYILLRIILLPAMFMRVIAPKGIDSLTYLFTQFRAWIYYLDLFLWPHPLILEFDGFGWSRSLWEQRVLLSLGVIVLILGLAWALRKTHAVVTFFMFWFFVVILPDSSFIQLDRSIVGYRPYLANAGLSVVAVYLSLDGSMWIWDKIRGAGEKSALRFRLAYGLVFAMILSVLTGATIIRNRDWRDDVSLWSDVLKKDPSNPRAYAVLGSEILVKEKDPTGVLGLLDRVIEADPKNSNAYMLRAAINKLQGRMEEAFSDLNRAMEFSPALQEED